MIGPPSLSPSSVVALTGNKSDSCQLSTQNATNYEGQMTGVHGMGGIGQVWTMNGGIPVSLGPSPIRSAKTLAKAGISALCRSAIVTWDLKVCCLVLARPTERLS
jgi:hypothetical protein